VRECVYVRTQTAYAAAAPTDVEVASEHATPEIFQGNTLKGGNIREQRKENKERMMMMGKGGGIYQSL